MKRKNLLLALSTLVILAVKLPAQIITTQPTNQVVIGGNEATFSVAVSGTGSFTYQWQFNGTNLPNNIITTVAGNGSRGHSGDGGPATNASLNTPKGVAVDASGNLFIVDWNQIRKVGTNGIITTVAGYGSSGYSGDGGPATSAMLYHPSGVTVDAFDSLFIADMDNNRIRKVDTNGIITTVAGNGTNGYSGDGGPATTAKLYRPYGAMVDAFDSLFIADMDNNRIRKVDADGIITTVAGNGSEGYSGDGGAATNASLSNPEGVAVDASGNLFIADFGNSRIRKVDTNGIITTVAGNGSQGYSGDGGPATNATLFEPNGVAVDIAGNVFIVDNNRIRKVDTYGTITTVAGSGPASPSHPGYSGDGGPAIYATLDYPSDVAVDDSGTLFIADWGNNRIREVTPPGGPMLVLSNVTTEDGGSYAVIISGASGSVTSSIVTLTVVFTPSITSQPQNVTVTNGNPASLTVAASGTEPLNYQWYFNTNAPVDGGTNATLAFAGALTNETGSYFCVISNAYGSITSSAVTLTVVPVGSLQVNITPAGAVSAGAQWHADGGAWQASGTILSNVVAGSHTVGFSNIAGWTTPTTQTVAVAMSQTTVATGLYVQQFGNLQVTLSPAGAISLGAQWQLDGGAWQNSGTILSNLTLGAHTVSFLSLNSWITPSNQTVTVVSGQTTNVTGTYIALGSLQVIINPIGVVSAGAQWRVDSSTWQTSGSVVSNLIAGTHTVSFTNIAGWTTPSNQTVTVNLNQTTVVTGVYAQILGSLQVVLSPAGAVSAGAQWQVDGGAWQASGTTLTNVVVGNHAVGYAAIAGWTAPTNQTVTIVSNQTTRITAVYQGQGSLQVILMPTGAIISGAQWQVDGGGWLNSGAVVSGLSGSAHTVAYKAASGWVAPANQSVSVLANQATVTNGVYTGLGYGFSTVAGTAGSPGFAEGTNHAAWFDTPVGMAVDLNSSLFIADTGNSVIRKLTPTTNGWVSSTIAGLAGSPGNADGTNSQARFDYPTGVAVDTNGNVYVADQVNSTVRRISPVGTNWVVSTLAGLARNYGSANGTNGVARFYYPAGVAVDVAGNLYVADQINSTIRKLTPLGSNNWAVTTIAGTAGVNGSADGTNNAARFYWPSDLRVDGNGNIYVADTFNNTIRKIAPVGTNFVVSTVCGVAGVNGSVDGTNSGALLDGPSAISLDAAGNLFVADSYSSVIRKITPVGTNWVVNTIGGLAYATGATDGTNSTARFDGPYGVCANAGGTIFVADTENDIIRAGSPVYPLPPIPNLRAMNGTTNGFGFSWSAMPGLWYQVQYKTDLVQGDWINLGASMLATNSPMPFVDSALTDAERFYRVVVLP